MQIRRFVSSAALAAGLIAGPALAAEADTDNADDKIPEIVVTADKFAKSIQDTPIAVSVITGEQISENGSTKIDDVLKNEPAVIVQGAARGFLVSIRGLGLSLPPQMGQGAVSTNYDGAFSNRAESASAGFYDLDRVEVLRGPQGTLYGRNSVGGVVNIISRNPVLGLVEGYVTAEAGDYSLFHGEGAVNVPLGSTMALRVSGSGVSRDGYMSNGHDDNKAYSGRAKLLIEPGTGFRVILGAEYTALRGKGPGAVPIPNVEAGNRNTSDVAFGSQHANSWKAWADITAEIGPGVLHILPAWQEIKGTTLGAFGGNFNWAADPKLNRQKQVELRYGSAAGSPLEWSIGFYHYDARNLMQTIAGTCEDTAGNYVIPAPGYDSVPPGPPGPAAAGTCIPANLAPLGAFAEETRTSRTDGVFGQITIPLGNTFKLIAGARYTWEKFDGINGDGPSGAPDFLGPLANVSDSHFDYRLGFEAELGANSMLYATTASGYRQGGYSFDLSPYAPEEMTSYEIGMKNRFADGKMLLNASAFYYDYEAFQLTVLQFFPAFSISVPTMPAREYGVELESVISVGERGKFNASVSYLNSRLEGINGAYAGVPFPNSPEWSVKLGYEHGFDLGGVVVTPRGDLRFASSSIVFPEQTPVPDTHPSVQNDYVTGDVSLKFEFGEDLTVLAYIKNFNDAVIKQSHFFGYAQLAAPRTYGATASYRF